MRTWGPQLGPAWPRAGRRLAIAVLAAGALAATAACAPAATPGDASATPASPQPGKLESLSEQVASQATRIAMLETKVGLPVPTYTPTPLPPTPTMVPAVEGLVLEGATKGVATAKVTVTEYADYL